MFNAVFFFFDFHFDFFSFNSFDDAISFCKDQFFSFPSDIQSIQIFFIDDNDIEHLVDCFVRYKRQ